MKNCFNNGFFLSIASFLLTLVVFICGLQSDPAHLSAGRWIGGLGGLAIGVFFVIRGIKARRSAVPPGQAYTYGQAFLTGMGIQLFAALFNVLTTYLYFKVINPHLTDVIIQAQSEKLQERGMSGDQIDKAEHIARIMTAPAVQAGLAFLGTIIIGGIIVLIVAAILQRPASEEQSAA